MHFHSRRHQAQQFSEKVVCRCARGKWHLFLVYSSCKALLEKAGFAPPGQKKIDRLQVGCSKLTGIPGVACLDLHSHTFKQTSPHMREDIQSYALVHKHPDPYLLPPSSETLSMNQSTNSKEENMSSLGGHRPYSPVTVGMQECVSPGSLSVHIWFFLLCICDFYDTGNPLWNNAVCFLVSA